MLEFKTITLSDRIWMTKLLREENTQSADYNFTNMYAWNQTFHQKVCESNGKLLIKLFYKERPFYSFPVGNGDTENALYTLKEDAELHQIPLKIRGVTEKMLEKIEKIFPEKFIVEPELHTADYVYSIDKLATMSGKKLHSKRNHISQFLRNYPQWNFEPISLDNLSECKTMCAEWINRQQSHNEFSNEIMALERVFHDFEELNIDGGLIRVSGKVIAFTLGEILCNDTYVTHFEKAFTDIKGSYSIMIREFSRYIQTKYPKIRYMNREDDMGLESLQKAKRSLYPIFMVEKFIVTWY